MHPLSMPNLFLAFRPKFDDEAPNAYERAFLRPAGVADTILRTQGESLASALRAEAMVEERRLTAPTLGWVELPRKLDYLRTILALGCTHAADRIEFVLAHARDEWRVDTVNRSQDSFDNREDLPAAWAGRRGEALARATAYCHTGQRSCPVPH